MLRKRLPTIVAAIFAHSLLNYGSCAQADTVTFSLVSDVTGSVGSTITVFGNLTNTTADTQYFGNDAINLTAPPTVATASDDIILNGLFGTGPTSIAAGATLSNVDLFSVQILGGSGSYTGNTFQLFGGTDAIGCASGAADCNNLLGTANFSLSVASAVPEPAIFSLIGGGLALLALMRRRLTLRGAKLNEQLGGAWRNGSDHSRVIATAVRRSCTVPNGHK